MTELLGPDGQPVRQRPEFGFQPAAETERSYAASRPRRRAYFQWGEQPNVDAEAQPGPRPAGEHGMDLESSCQ